MERNRITAIFIDAAFWVLLLAITFNHEFSNIADNLLTFAVCVITLMYFLLIFSFAESCEKLREKVKTMSKFYKAYSVISSVGKIIVFVGLGFLWMASAYTFTTLMAFGLVQKAEELNKEKPATE